MTIPIIGKFVWHLVVEGVNDGLVPKIKHVFGTEPLDHTTLFESRAINFFKLWGWIGYRCIVFCYFLYTFLSIFNISEISIKGFMIGIPITGLVMGFIITIKSLVVYYIYTTIIRIYTEFINFKSKYEK